ncbi:MAG: hypothetical protein LBG91_01940 [Treponema sp.]|jgi:hypothetical protein|nr:hypothetical protein [Treponema sp.]
MRKAGIILFLLLLGLSVLLYAQEEDSPEDEGPSIGAEWDDLYAPDLYIKGDQTFIMSIGTAFPAVFFNNGKVINHNLEPPVGGTGSLSYNYFFGARFFVGGEICGMFMPTLGVNTLFVIPLGVQAGYQFTLRRFEFPLTAGLGMVWHRYLDFGYYGFYMKGGAAAYFRFNSDWSFGLNANWRWLPEWTKDPKENVDGNIVDLRLSVRYHF